MLKIGDRVVDKTVESRYGKVWKGTIRAVHGTNVVSVQWDCDFHWVDTAYAKELRLISEGNDEQFV